MSTHEVWQGIEFFKSAEFDSPDAPGSGGECMDPALIEKLDYLRAEFGHPLKITSGYRTEAHNKKVGGKESSAHLTGYAADIATPTSSHRFDLVRLALQYGVRRIGIGQTFVHLDMHPTLPQGVIWLY